MKALRTILTAIVLLTGAMTMNAQPMNVVAIQSNARFLTDRMAYTLGISDPYLIDEIYRINYDYIWGVNDYLDDVALGYYYDDYMTVVAARDAALRNLLGYTIWNRLISYSYFYRPIVFANHRWHFSIYDYDRYGVRHFFYGAPRPIVHGYAGGHFFRPMAPVGGRRMAPPPPAPRRPHAGMPPRGGAPAPRVAPRGGAPAPGVAPRGGAPAHGVAPHRGQMNNVPPRTNIANQNTNVNHNTNTNVNVNVNQNANSGANGRDMRSNMNTGSGMRGGNGGMRSNNNMGSSSRSSSVPTRSSAPTRSAAPVSGGTRGSMGGHGNMGGRGGGGGRGGSFGGGRR